MNKFLDEMDKEDKLYEKAIFIKQNLKPRMSINEIIKQLKDNERNSNE